MFRDALARGLNWHTFIYGVASLLIVGVLAVLALSGQHDSLIALITLATGGTIGYGVGVTQKSGEPRV